MKNVKFRHSIILFLVLSLTILLLAGCGTNNSAEPAGSTVDTSKAITVGLDVCTSCHSQQTTDWKSSAHSNISTTEGLNSAGSPTYGDLLSGPTCANCHDQLGDGKKLTPNWTGNVERPVVGCESCHGGGSLHYGPGPIAMTRLTSSGTGTYAQSAQFNTCTQCHQLMTSTTTIADNGGESFITTTHAAVPGDARLTTGTSPSFIYFVKKADEQACTACHNPHKADTAINRQYAESAHGDPLGTAWRTYDWKYSNDADPSNDRKSCQRCHTTTGFKNFANSPTTYNPSNNDFSYLLGTELSTTSRKDNNDQKETIYCWGCHVDNKGGLRNPGRMTADYGVVVNIPITSTTSTSVTYDSVSYSYPDVKGSNICMVCHTGRRSGDSIKNLNQQAGMPSADFSNLAFINDHHYTAGGTVFTASGYEFTGRNYENPVSYMHDRIGSSAAPNTGSNGPCVGCHMSRTEKHLFLPVDTTTGDVTGTITNVAAPVCDNCHTGGDPLVMSPAMLENQKALFNDALTALGYQFEKQDLYNRSGSVYRVRDTQVISAGTVTVNGTLVIGTGTKWLTTGVEPLDKFRIDNDGTWYTIAIAGVVTDTQITLASSYTGIAGVSMAANYTILKSETVSASTGSTIITGTGTNWMTTGVAAGDYFRIYSDGTYTIASVVTDTQITLASSYTGTTVTNAAYSIRNGGTVDVVQTSATVTGNGTNWINEDVTAGDYFRVDSDGTWYRIKSRNSAVSLTLGSSTATTPYNGPTAPGVSYTIIRGSTRNWLSGGDTDLTGNTTGKNNMGAALNLYMFHDEPGAFAHNRYYTKREIYDSIDWLDDGALNYSVGVTLNALPGTGVTSYKAGAMTYLLPNGVVPNNNPVERP